MKTSLREFMRDRDFEILREAATSILVRGKKDERFKIFISI